MLTTDLVRVRRRAGRIEVPRISQAQRTRLTEVAEHLVAIVQAHQGRTRGELQLSCDRVPHRATDFKVVKGLRKLLLDRCTFESAEKMDARTLRRLVFAHAAQVRAALEDAALFDREQVLAAISTSTELTSEVLEANLFADLAENHRLVAIKPITPLGLVDAYELAQEQAVLLRAASVVVHLKCHDSASARWFINALKFRRLLFELHRTTDDTWKITIDGPFSLFQAVTKYGLQLALILPILRRAGTWRLDADIRWGKQRESYSYHLEGEPAPAGGNQEKTLSEDAERLVSVFGALDNDWELQVSTDFLELPGVGLCVPDLLFTHRPTGKRVFLEILGYWSRKAVWRRVELVQAGLPYAIIFAVSSRLRVSEEVLDADLPGQLFVFKGTISASQLVKRLDMMATSQ